MTLVLTSMVAIIALGIGWRLLLGSDSADTARSHLALAVYHLFLPALVLQVLWQTPVDMNTLRIPLVSALSVLLSMLAAFLIYGNGLLARKFLPSTAKASTGALLLAASFGNFSYLGLPVLTQTFGDWAQMVAIQFDLLASTPLLFTVGIMLARYYGGSGHGSHPLLALLQVPAFWAAVAGLALSLAAIDMPPWLHNSLKLLGSAVVPLMLLSVGMALRWQSGWLDRIPLLLPVILIQLLLMPLIAWGACIGAGLPERLVAPAVIEAAMPTMVLGLVICDRFRLDTALYAQAITLTTILSLLTLPLWLAAMT